MGCCSTKIPSNVVVAGKTFRCLKQKVQIDFKKLLAEIGCFGHSGEASKRTEGSSRESFYYPVRVLS